MHSPEKPTICPCNANCGCQIYRWEHYEIVVFDFCNLKVDEQTRQFCLTSQKREVSDVFGVYKGKKNPDEWESRLDQNIINSIYSEINGSELEQFL